VLYRVYGFAAGVDGEYVGDVSGGEVGGWLG
jgi:hypothetical protein